MGRHIDRARRAVSRSGGARLTEIEAAAGEDADLLVLDQGVEASNHAREAASRKLARRSLETFGPRPAGQTASGLHACPGVRRSRADAASNLGTWIQPSRRATGRSSKYPKKIETVVDTRLTELQPCPDSSNERRIAPAAAIRSALRRPRVTTQNVESLRVRDPYVGLRRADQEVATQRTAARRLQRGNRLTCVVLASVS
jgi:hypothetical protein